MEAEIQPRDVLNQTSYIEHFVLDEYGEEALGYYLDTGGNQFGNVKDFVENNARRRADEVRNLLQRGEMPEQLRRDIAEEIVEVQKEDGYNDDADVDALSSIYEKMLDESMFTELD